MTAAAGPLGLSSPLNLNATGSPLIAGIGRGLAAHMDPGAEMWTSADSWARHCDAMDKQAKTRARARFGKKKTRRQLRLIRSRQDKPRPGEAVDLTLKAYRLDARATVSRPKMLRESVAVGSKEIWGFSAASRRRLKFLMRNTRGNWDGFITLTYPKGHTSDGRKVKQNLNAFLQFLRRKKIAYVWVLEFQANGQPHFHIFCRGWLGKAALSHAWYSIVGSGNPDHLKCGTQIKAIKHSEQAENYMGAYASKKEQKKVPKAYKSVGRFWGASRALAAAVETVIHTTYAGAARILRDMRNRNRAEFRALTKKEDRYRWRWNGSGFECRGGAGVYWSMVRRSEFKKQFARAMREDCGEAMRNATLAPALAAVAGWVAERNGQPRPGVYLSPEEMEARRGQMLIVGGLETVSSMRWGK